MTVFLKLYTLALGISLASYTYYLIVSKDEDKDPSMLPLLFKSMYYTGEGIDMILFNGGVNPKKEIFQENIVNLPEQ